ncbi:DUF350 domain-containing protein [Rhodoferax sp. 4810]|uniref:DUF350 domain-containing protein n=1 Tax=Thiospirillum jenense TaxID=1653858 RepID=A0A839HJB3_9GAMM|nr:DUF350 domain-containing protein [Thiospirillum jenense]MBB1075803.1 DUF350 domain-containing protein [Rhodoferax jenense]MBB1126877.1 DUF350 domain-containing protein [Thiospirillum jenense]
MADLFATLWQTLNSGLPILLLHFVTTLVLLALGAALYMVITPFNERELIAQGNIAAGLALSGALVSITIPLAATLATNHIWLDIMLWGIIAILVQLLTVTIATVLFRGFRSAIEQGNIAIAAVLVGVQLAIALLNAGAMVG